MRDSICWGWQARQGHSFLQSLPGILRSKLGSPRRAVCMLCIVAAILQQLLPALTVLLRLSYQRRDTRLQQCLTASGNANDAVQPVLLQILVTYLLLY